MSNKAGAVSQEGTKSKVVSAYLKQTTLFVLWALVGLLAVCSWLFPIKFASLRLLLIGSGCVFAIATLILFWRYKPLRFFCLALFGLIAALLILPGREYSGSQLRSDYVASLQTYEDSPYVWGGESGRGIDCSGLIRCGLIDATLHRGIKTLNPVLVRRGLSLWWHDASAKAMKEGYRKDSQLLFQAESLNTLDTKRLQPGDFAITSNGVHALAYIGNKTWIEADPTPMRVIRVQTPTRNAWFSMPVHIMRWREFERG
jgi:hypothetical protein